MKVNKWLHKFIQRHMIRYECNGSRCLLIKRNAGIFVFYAMWLSNEHLRRYLR